MLVPNASARFRRDIHDGGRAAFQEADELDPRLTDGVTSAVTKETVSIEHGSGCPWRTGKSAVEPQPSAQRTTVHIAPRWCFKEYVDAGACRSRAVYRATGAQHGRLPSRHASMYSPPYGHRLLIHGDTPVTNRWDSDSGRDVAGNGPFCFGIIQEVRTRTCQCMRTIATLLYERYISQDKAPLVST